MKRKSGDSRQNPVFEEKRRHKASNFLSDPKLVPRVQQYLDSNKQKQLISVIAMADDIQARYSRDYGRKKKNAFRISVEKAYEVILSSQKSYSKCEIKHLEKRQKTSAEQDSEDSSLDSDIDSELSFSSDNPDYTIHKDTNAMNSCLSNMYKKPSKDSLASGSHSNPSSCPGSAAGTPKMQTADSEDVLFVIDRRGDTEYSKVTGTKAGKGPSGTARKSSRSGNGSCPGSLMISNSRASPAKTTTRLTPKCPDENREQISQDNSEVIIIDGEQTNSEMSVSNDQSKVKVNVNADTVKTNKKEKETPLKRKERMKEGKTTKKRQKADEGKPSEKPGRKAKELQMSTVTFADVGGNTSILTDLCKLLVHMKHPEVYEKLGVTPPRGFLLHGPPGCGKTLLAHAIAGELELPFLKVAATELVSGVSGDSEEKIRETFENASASAPCVLFLDEIDAITPKRETASKDMERRIVSQLLTCMDDLNSKPNGQVLVIGATNRPDSLDPALRRAGRFDREIPLGIPDEEARKRILMVLCRDLRLSADFDFPLLARNTPGYVGADLMALARESAIVAVNRVFKELQTSTESDIKCDKTKDFQGDKIEPCHSGVTGTNISETHIDCCTDTEAVAVDVSSANSDHCNSTSDSPLQLDTNGGTSEKNMVFDAEDESSLTKDSQHKASDNLLKNVNAPSEGSNRAGHRVPECTDAEFNLILTWLKEHPPLSEAQLSDLFITWEDFQEALKYVQPSAKREGFATIPDVTWEDIGALKEVREELQMSILAPVRHPEQFRSLGLTNPPGILLAGPPGCGKTLLAKAVANESGINFISVKGPELLNMYVGESERAVRQVFQRARNSSPCVIFFDELDALCPRRSSSGEGGASVRVVNQLLTEMDGLETRKQVFIMGATNRPDIIDPAVLRPGRLDKLLYVGLPSADDRLDILNTITKKGTKPLLSADVDLRDVASQGLCNGFTGADLAALVREASVAALKEFMSQSQTLIQPVVVMKSHFDLAFKKVKPSVTSKDQLLYEKMKERISIS